MHRLLNRFLLCLLCLWSAGVATAQTPLSVSTIIRTPTPASLTVWQNDPTVVRVVITNPGTTVYPNCYITFTARNVETNKILAQTKPNAPASPRFTIPAGGVVVNGRNVVSVDAVDLDASFRTIVTTTNSFPEGVYEVCVKVVSGTGAVLGSAPCVLATILVPDPPTLISPALNAELTKNAGFTPVTFNWTPVQSLGGIVRYTLRVSPMFKGQTPRFAAENNPALLLRSGLVSTNYVYLPSDPAFSLYTNATGWAWQVQALDALGNPYTRNEGRSEIFSFKFKPAAGNPPAYNPVGSNPPAYTPPPTVLNTLCRLKGQLKSDRHNDDPQTPAQYLPPLKNTVIKLVQYDRLFDVKVVSGNLSAPKNSTRLNRKFIATTTTDAGGNFTFDFVNADSMGLRQNNQAFSEGGGEFKVNYTADVHRVLCIEVENPYYTSPSTHTVVQPGQTVTLDEPWLASVRTFALKVTAKAADYTGDVYGKNQPFANATVYLMRRQSPSNLPSSEPNLGLYETDGDTYTLVAKQQTSSNGTVTFPALTNTLGAFDQYTVRVEPDAQDLKAYWFPYQQMNYQTNPLPAGQIWLGIEDGGAKFSDEYPYPRPKREVMCLGMAENPTLRGTVYGSDVNANTPVQGVKLNLGFVDPNSSGSSGIKDTELSDASGNFSFGQKSTSPEGSFYIVNASKDGYGQQFAVVNGGKRLLKGQAIQPLKIFLKPKGFVKGYVASAEDTLKGVSATVSFDDGEAIPTVDTPAWIQTSGFAKNVLQEQFTYAVASGQNRKLTVVPNSSDYFPETLYVEVSSGTTNLGAVKLTKKLRRLALLVRRKDTNAPVAGAQVQVYTPNGTALFKYPFKSGADGVTHLAFESPGADNAVFKVEVRSPNDLTLSYVTKTWSGAIPVAKTEKPVTLKLSPAAMVSGRVLAGKTSTGIKNARVYLETVISNGVSLEAFTDATGAYTLRGVPLSVSGNFNTAHSFRAVKSASQFIGADTSIKIMEAKSYTGVNLRLEDYEGMDITALLGLPIEVSALDSNAQGVRISGNYVELPDNKFFSLNAQSGTEPLKFTNVVIKPDAANNAKGIPYAVPQSGSVVTDKNDLKLKAFNTFGAVARTPASGAAQAVTVTATPVFVAGKTRQLGVINSRAFIDAGSLSDDAVFADSKLWLAKSGGESGATVAERTILPVIIADGVPPLSAAALTLSQADGKSLAYTLQGFGAVADSSKSVVQGDSIKLSTTLSVALVNPTPMALKLNLGAVVLRPSGLSPLNGTSTVSFPLEQWTVESQNWSLTAQDGFILKTGVLKMGVVTAPFTDITIQPTQLVTATAMQSSSISLTLGGMASVVTQVKPVFSYDGSKQHWAFTVAKPSGAAATLSALTGMNPADKLTLSSLSLYSDGSNQLVVSGNTPSLTIHKVAKFSPSQIAVSNNSLSLGGTLDLGLAGVTGKASALNYTKSGNTLALSVQPFDLNFTANAVTLNFGQNWSLTDKGVSASGTVKEAGALDPLNVSLSRTTDSTGISLAPNQVFDIGGNNSTRLQNLLGGLRVNGTAWSPMIFSGDLAGTDGATGRLVMRVTGDIETNGNQTVALKNIETPVGSLSVTFDYPNRALHGSLTLDDIYVPNSYRLNGGADAHFDKLGWYFASRANLQLYNPYMGFMMAVALGNYPNIAGVGDIQQHFNSEQWAFSVPEEMKKIPAEYVNLKGFYFYGQATNFIIPLPSLDLNLDPFIHCGVYPQYGMALGLGMNFAGDGTQFNVYGAGFVEVRADAGGSVGLVCAGADLKAGIVLRGTGKLNTGSGDWSLAGGQDIVLEGSFYAGAGLICDSNCDGFEIWTPFGDAEVTPCFKKSFGPAKFKWCMMEFKMDSEALIKMAATSIFPIP